jgi:hypothetical protein
MKRHFFAYFSCALLITSGQVLGQTAGQTCNPNIVKTKPDSQYELLNNDTEVKDKKTGLIWQRCALGMSWNGTTCNGTVTTYNWENALAQAASVANSTGVAWRLPNIKELKSLVETACYDQSINEFIFPNALDVWSSTTSPYYAGNSAHLHFSDGHIGGYVFGDDKSVVLAVRLVRGE